MKRFNEYLTQQIIPIPEQVKQYRAYKDGESKIFNNRQDAMSFSVLIEEIIDRESLVRRKEAIAANSKANELAYSAWYADLRAEYSHLTDAVFDVVYAEAYDRGHYAGADEVANYVISVADFAKRIIDAGKV